jgi:hypothetical protein
MSENNNKDIVDASGSPDTTVAAPVVAPQVPEKSPWCSINDMLIHNRCWLCENIFARGKTKKVFQVSHLLTFYHNNWERSKEIKSIEEKVKLSVETTDEQEQMFNRLAYTFKSRNLKNCYERYIELMTKGEGQPTKLFKEFKENDIEVWMSGLVCGVSEDCKTEAAYFCEVKKHNPASSSSAADAERKEKINSMFSFAMPSADGNCPPGCGCDNPWPFMP